MDPIIPARPRPEPAALAHSGAWFRELRGVLGNLWRRRRLYTLLDQDDRLLYDIGVTRDDVVWAINLPWSENASDALARRSRRRRAGENAAALRQIRQNDG